MSESIYTPSPWQQRFHACKCHEMLGAGAAGPGKALDLATPIPTKDGWVWMRDVDIGEEVFDENGEPCRVVGVRDFANRPVYEVGFDDGEVIIADAEHEWFTMDYNERASVRRTEKRGSRRTGLNEQQYKRNMPALRTTAAIAEAVKYRGRANHAVMLTKPLNLPDRELPIDPWILGMWLGDGTSDGGKFTSADAYIVERVAAAGFEPTKLTAPYSWGTRGLSARLRGLGLNGARRLVKHIPPMYLRAGRGQRMDVLRGLVDTDGHIDRDGRCEITLCNQTLADDVYELVVGLGFKCTRRESAAMLKGREVGRRWRMAFSPRGIEVASMPRKVARIGQGQRTSRWRYIVRCEPVEARAVRCIEVDSQSRLYLAGFGMVPTHNSTALRMDPLDQIVTEHDRMTNPEHPYPIRKGESHGHSLYLRREASMLEETIREARRAYSAIDPSGKWFNDSSGGGTFTFASGYRAQFGHCKDPDDWEKYQGTPHTWIGYDELTQFLEEQYRNINLWLRIKDPILAMMLRIRACTNPMMRRQKHESFVIRDPHWVRRYFVDPAPNGNVRLYTEVTLESGEVVQRDRIYLPARLKDNPDKAFVRQYEIQLQGAPPHIRQALLMGNWYVTADSFYAWAWSPALHVVKAHRIPRYWRIFRSMDWGYKLPGTVGYYAMDDDDHLTKFKEITFQGKTDVEVAELLKQYETRAGFWGDRGSKLTGPADTQLWERRGDSNSGGFAKTKAQVFQEKGVLWLPANKKRRQDNAQLLLKRLADHGDRSKLPGIMFFEGCENTIKTLPAIPTDPGNSECPMDGGEDHWHDETLYACEYASRGPKFLRPFEDLDDDAPKQTGLNMPRNYGYG